jgi:transcriptional regulator with XRE-family HTH domain
MAKTTDFRWVQEGIAGRGFLGRDLAKAWGISESSVSRFFKGIEQPDLPLSRAITLATMLGISLDELAKGLGVMGKKVEPNVQFTQDGRAPKVPNNSVQLTMLGDDKVRLAFSTETTPTKAMEVIKILSVN